MNEAVLAYLAGAMDSDGFFGIKRHTYAMRVRGDATQPMFSERCGLKQVTPHVPTLLRDTFGGVLRTDRPQTVNSRPMWNWQATDKIAATCASALLPHLRIKATQARLLLELRRSKSEPFGKLAHWWSQENPDWRSMPMLTYRQVASLLGYKGIGMVSQAVRNGTLLALPLRTRGIEVPRVPAALVDAVKTHVAKSKDGRGRCRPERLMAWREQLWLECRGLNRIGTGDHPINTLTGPYVPAC